MILFLAFVETGEANIEGLGLQGFNLNTQKLFVPASVHRHTVVREDISFLLRFGEVVSKYTRHLGDTLFTGSKNTTVTGDNAIVTVDDDGIDEAELSERGSELVDLGRRMCLGIVRIGDELI